MEGKKTESQVTGALSDAPDLIKFTELERLEVENIQLKMALTQQEMQRLTTAQAEWVKKVSARVGIADFNKHYAINVADGTAKKIGTTTGIRREG